jgi:hypothetical protein
MLICTILPEVIVSNETANQIEGDLHDIRLEAKELEQSSHWLVETIVKVAILYKCNKVVAK